MSNGTNLIVTGNLERGQERLEEARRLFESNESYDYRQGLGWYWILQADLTNAGILQREPSEVIEIANRTLEVLKPIENWPGVARAYAARAAASMKLGNEAEAAKDRKEQAYYESLAGPEED